MGTIDYGTPHSAVLALLHMVVELKLNILHIFNRMIVWCKNCLPPAEAFCVQAGIHLDNRWALANNSVGDSTIQYPKDKPYSLSLWDSQTHLNFHILHSYFAMWTLLHSELAFLF